MKKLIHKLCIGLLCVSACGNENALDGVESMSLNSINDNGIALNGMTLNGMTLNGMTLNGMTLNGMTLNGMTLNGMTLNGSALSATLADNNSTIAGKAFVGVRATFKVPNGGPTVVLRIDDAIYNTLAGMYVYNVSIQTDTGWAPICGTENGVPIPAVPAPGSWDLESGDHNSSSNNITVACVNAAIGKCIVWGYRPWDNKSECSGLSCRSQSLNNWQEACTRLVRADYCGDGVPHTRNGTPINVWDTLGIQLDVNTTWDLEAEWATDGAHCIKHTRWTKADLNSPYATDYSYVVKNCPSRLASSGSESCGTDSDFNTKKGLYTATSKRKLLRNESALNQ